MAIKLDYYYAQMDDKTWYRKVVVRGSGWKSPPPHSYAREHDGQEREIIWTHSLHLKAQVEARRREKQLLSPLPSERDDELTLLLRDAIMLIHND